MSEAEAETLINAELPNALDIYIELYDGYSEFKKEQEEQAVGWIGETTDESEVVLLGSRYKVLSLVWIAGLLELEGCQVNVDKAINIAIKQRDAMYRNPKYSDRFKRTVLENVSIYNRQLLLTGLAGVLQKPSALSSYLQEAEVIMKHFQSTAYNARFTQYDLPVRSFYGKPDYLKGKFTIGCFSPIDDSTFEQAISICRERTR